MTDDIYVRFVCGHEVVIPASLPVTALACECGERRVSTVKAPPPRVRAKDCDAKSPLLQETR